MGNAHPRESEEREAEVQVRDIVRQKIKHDKAKNSRFTIDTVH
jgi:hypothetical protein